MNTGAPHIGEISDLFYYEILLSSTAAGQFKGISWPAALAAMGKGIDAAAGFMTGIYRKRTPDGRALYLAFCTSNQPTGARFFCLGYFPITSELAAPPKIQTNLKEPRPHEPLAETARRVFDKFPDPRRDPGLYHRLLDFADMRAQMGNPIRTAWQARNIVDRLKSGATHSAAPRLEMFSLLGTAIEKQWATVYPRQTENNIIQLSDFMDRH